jgi:hypothetical protein
VTTFWTMLLVYSALSFVVAFRFGRLWLILLPAGPWALFYLLNRASLGYWVEGWQGGAIIAAVSVGAAAVGYIANRLRHSKAAGEISGRDGA